MYKKIILLSLLSISSIYFLTKTQSGNSMIHHTSISVNDWEKSLNFYEQTFKELGGKDNGKPGPRPEYHPGYYGAFIIDPDGWRIEACLHDYKK